MAPSRTNHSETLIVGAGAFGTSTAYHLAKTHHNPASITVIDKTPFPPEHAASTDINKIIRADYSTRFYMDLAQEAIDAWDSWPELKGKGYYHRTGWINIKEKGSDLAERIRKNFRDRGDDPTKDYTLDELKQGFGGIFQHTVMDGHSGAYWNPIAGWCDAGLATAEMMQSAVDKGVKYVVGSVGEIMLGAEDVEGVTLSDGQVFTADKVLLASGAWTSSLMTGIEDQLNIDDADRIEKQIMAAGVCVAHYKLRPDELEHLKQYMPVVIYGGAGDIQISIKDQLIKFTNGASFTNTTTTSTGKKISIPPDREQNVVSEKLKQETSELITGKVLTQFTTDRSVEFWRLCWDAVSPSQDHLITKHPNPKLKNLYLAVGGSFHSYKFLPNIGKYVVNVLNGESNGAEKDQHWCWKTTKQPGRGAHEKAYPTRELKDLE